MRKSTKIAVVLAAAALLVAGFAFTTLAKGWVKEAEGLYYYEDAEGMKVYNTWEKDTDPNTGVVNFYYLGDDGYMVINKLIDGDDGYKYWVGADGAKVTNAWVQVPADDEDTDSLGVDYRWYRFNAKGQAIKGKQTVNGETYFFDDNYKMVFGYVLYDADTKAVSMKKSISDKTDGTSYNYYCGSNEEGKAVKSTWRKETVDKGTSTYDDSDSFWTFFKSGGVKATAADANGVLWNGVRYFFDENGTMVTGWNVATVATNPDVIDARYFGGEDDGKMVKKGWAYVKPNGASADDKFWFYFDNTGAAIKKAGVSKINGKFYAFGKADNYASKMLANLVELTYNGVTVANPTMMDATGAENVKPADYTLKDWLAETFEEVYYFSGDEKNDGSLKKNVNFTAEFKDDNYTLSIDNAGKLYNYFNTKTKKYYKNGYLIKASEEMRYELKEVWTKKDTKKLVLLTTSGTEVASGTVTDADGSYYYVVKSSTAADGTIVPKKVYVADSSLLSAAKAIAAIKNGTLQTKIDDVPYTVKTNCEYSFADGDDQIEIYSVALQR